jgi:NTE family protein
VRKIALIFMTFAVVGMTKLHPDEVSEPGTTPTSGPTVGLALAGGGALGFAHLGVILFLEEIGLDPQYLSGTSIGSIVGALYAAGYTGEEMLDIVRSADWSELLFDAPIRTSLAVDAREATRRYRLTARFNEWNLVTPTGFSAGQRVTEFLDALLWQYADTDSFHTLPRPIGIVATDLLTGTEVVYTSGDLKSAVRASIAVPGILTPLRYDGRYLIDGGWSNNLPVDVVKDLGADIVIAVDLFEPDRSIDELQDIGSIVEQAGIILRQERVRENRALADIVIVPDLEGYTTVDFDRAMELVELGRTAAEEQREQLLALRDRVIAERGSAGRTSGTGHSGGFLSTTGPPSPNHFPSPDRSNRPPHANRLFHIDAVHLDVPPDRDTPDSLKQFYLSFLGNEYTAAELRSAVYALYDSGEYEYVSYDLTAEKAPKPMVHTTD